MKTEKGWKEYERVVGGGHAAMQFYRLTKVLPGASAFNHVIVGQLNTEVLNYFSCPRSYSLPAPLYKVMWKAANKSMSEVDSESLLLRRKDPSTNSFSSLHVGSQTHS